MLPLVLWLVTLVAAVQATPQAPTAASPFGQGEARESGHRSQIRIRDPFVLPDPAAKVYYIYGSTNRGLSPSDARKEVVVYKTRDLEDWGEPITAWAVPAGHWGRETVWAPEVHRYQGKYYLFVTLTSTDTLPTPEGRPPNVKRGTEILVADRPEGPFTPFGHGPQTPHDWMSLDGTLYVEDGVPYMVFCHEWIQITDGSMDIVPLTADLSRGRRSAEDPVPRHRRAVDPLPRRSGRAVPRQAVSRLDHRRALVPSHQDGQADHVVVQLRTGEIRGRTGRIHERQARRAVGPGRGAAVEGRRRTSDALHHVRGHAWSWRSTSRTGASSARGSSRWTTAAID